MDLEIFLSTLCSFKLLIYIPTVSPKEGANSLVHCVWITYLLGINHPCLSLNLSTIATEQLSFLPQCSGHILSVLSCRIKTTH